MHKKGKAEVVVGIMIVVLLFSAVGIEIWFLYSRLTEKYIPLNAGPCPSGSSIRIKNIAQSQSDKLLSITIENDGQFEMDGYFIKVSSNESPNYPSKDISSRLIDEKKGERIFGSYVRFSNTENSLGLTEKSREKEDVFDITFYDSVTIVEITPVRFQNVGYKKELTICNELKVRKSFV